MFIAKVNFAFAPVQATVVYAFSFSTSWSNVAYQRTNSRPSNFLTSSFKQMVCMLAALMLQHITHAYVRKKSFI